jgi:CHAD domain-containing protein
MIKWLPDVSPVDRAVDVAARSLRSRLEAVRTYFRRSVKGPDEPENFHQLRVWTRRTESALDLYADLLPRRRVRKMRRTLKRIRRAAGRVRDCDVFAKRVTDAGGEWPADLTQERKRAHKKLVALYARLGRDRRLRRQVNKLIDRLRTRNADRSERFADRARDTLRPIAAAFFAASPGEACEADALHRFRLAGKDLRYAMELLAPAFDPSFRDEVYPVLSVLQEKLGTVNDLAAAQQRLEEQVADSGDPAEVSDLRRRQAAAGEELARVRQDFRRWWTPEMCRALQTRFEELLGPLSSGSPA